MKKILAAPVVAGLLLLAACSANTSAQNAPQANAQGGGFNRQNFQQNLQQFADEANNASDKTELTKDQFTAEMQTLIQTQRAQFQAGSGSMMARFGSGQFMRDRTGSGFMMRGSGSFAQGNGPRFGSGSSRGGFQNGLATATTFYKYTDSNGNEALIALDANGQVVFHWPMPFGRGRGGMMNGGQPPMGDNAPMMPAPAQQ
ncbi:MAG TPA: hypothetical protein VHA78_05970 [Candidatus Peribacteraceae bacterium]|nr:hypothetical protein [Candidatus Peribacteraceae bacterium]